MSETWLPIEGYEGYYEVSDHGRVRSLQRTVVSVRGVTRKFPSVILAGGTGGNGRRNVLLFRGNQAASKAIHRLVAHAFLGPGLPSQEVCHFDGNPTNNHVSNLRWDTHGNNMRDAVRIGTHINTAKTHCPRGHELAGPNLAPGAWRKGARLCLACEQARSGGRRITDPDFSAVADGHYERIRQGGRTTLDNSSKTHCKNGHEFAGENLAFDKKGNRRCRACHRARGQETYYRTQRPAAAS